MVNSLHPAGKLQLQHSLYCWAADIFAAQASGHEPTGPVSFLPFCESVWCSSFHSALESFSLTEVAARHAFVAPRSRAFSGGEASSMSGPCQHRSLQLLGLFIGLRGISPRHCRDSILLVVWTVTTLLQLETENIDIALVATLLSPGSRNPKCLAERIRKSHRMICLLDWKMYVYDITGWRLGLMD
jgi:hypothetical protein